MGKSNLILDPEISRQRAVQIKPMNGVRQKLEWHIQLDFIVLVPVRSANTVRYLLPAKRFLRILRVGASLPRLVTGVDPHPSEHSPYPKRGNLYFIGAFNVNVDNNAGKRMISLAGWASVASE